MDMLPNILFALAVVSFAAILILSTIALWSDQFQFWPPPSENSWQHKAFWWLFRGMVYPLILLTILTFEYDSKSPDYTRFSIGAALLLLGFGLAFTATFFLGWKNAYGKADGLKTTGWYAWSRNPIYVVTWIGLIGWGVVASSYLVSFVLIMWAFLYLIAPFFEEPWLEQKYGESFKQYKLKTRRFF
jgi:protein-S-isoprenylcysteine O-methyltransferase Ste14